MEMFLEILRDSVSGGFWRFIGFWILISLVVTAPIKIFRYFFRHLTIRKHGYPPEHCDGDGDFKKETDD